MSGSNLVRSVVRGLDILEWVAQAEGGMTLAQLATALDVQRPTAFNLARTLVSEGYLEKTSRPVRYRLGGKIATLHRIHRERGWGGRLEEGLTALGSRLGGVVVSSAEPAWGEIRVTARIDPCRPGQLERPLGRMAVPYSSVLALCFQAFWSSAERERYESRYFFQDYGRGVWVNRATLDSFLALSREREYVELRIGGWLRIAAPIYGYEGQLLAAIGAGSEPRTGETAPEAVAFIVEGVRQAARDLSLS